MKKNKNYSVHISFKYIRYEEANKTIELDLDPLVSKETILYLPTEEKWNQLYGDWARGRRSEILQNILNEFSDSSFIKIEEVQ